MKIIFSRKGIDDKYGGGFSPIFPDGGMMSIPIPQDKEKGQGKPYRDLKWKRKNMIDYFEMLKIKLVESDLCHLDPDLRSREEVGDNRWRGAFGQGDGAVTQLRNQEVQEGDLFLFFGNFRHVYMDNDEKWSVEPQHTKHVLFGYLQVGEIINEEDMNRSDVMEVYHDHPHIKRPIGYSPNILYLAREKLANHVLPGWGTFKYDTELDLTKPGYRKSIWKLPKFFHYEDGPKISYHGNHSRYRMVDDSLQLETVAMGQDFVVSESDEVSDWALKLIETHKAR